MLIRGCFGVIFSRSPILLFGGVLLSGRLMATELEPYEFGGSPTGYDRPDWLPGVWKSSELSASGRPLHHPRHAPR